MQTRSSRPSSKNSTQRTTKRFKQSDKFGKSKTHSSSQRKKTPSNKPRIRPEDRKVLIFNKPLTP